MEILIYNILCLLARKKVVVYFLYLLGTVAFISFTYKTGSSLFYHSTKWTTFLAHEIQYHEQRTHFLENKCKNVNIHPSLKSIKQNQILNYLGFVLQSHSLFYCSVPKVATRTLLTYITYLHIRDELIPSLTNNSISFNTKYFSQTFPDMMTNTSINQFFSRFISILKSNNNTKLDLWSMYINKALPHVRLQTLPNLSLLSSPSSIRAIFVRHPLERLASAYSDKIGTLKTEPQSTYDKLRQKICQKFIPIYSLPNQKQLKNLCEKTIPTFVHFLEYILTSSAQIDVHWQPYSTLCQACEIKYNFIGKYETIDEDLKLFQVKLSLNTIDWNVENRFSTGKTREAYRSMYSNLSKDLLCNLKNFYANDLELFNYRFEDYLETSQRLDCPIRTYHRFPI